MKAAIRNRLKKAGSRYFCSFWREGVSNDELFGIPLLLNDCLLLLAEYDRQLYSFSGYNLIRTADITVCSIYDSQEHYPYLVQRKLAIESPKVPLPLRQSLPAQLVLIGQSAPLFIIEKKGSHENGCWVGKLAKLTSKTLFLSEIDSEAAWIGTYQHRLDSISRVIWNDPYSTVLSKIGGVDPPGRET